MRLFENSQIGYGFKTGASSIGKHKAMSITSMITTAACLLLIAVVFMLGYNLQANVEEFQVDNTMLAFVDETFSENEAMALQSSIEQIDHVVSATFITREEAMNTYMAEYGEDDATTSRLSPSVFRDRYSVEVDDHGGISEIAKQVKAIDGIDDIRLDEKVSDGFSAVQRVVTVVGIVLAIMLLAIAIVIMTNTINLTMLARKDEISVMKMMGAYDGFIRFPFIVEGCVVGIIGAVIAYLFSSGVYTAVSNMMTKSGALSIVAFMPYKDIALPLAGLMLMLGLGVGIIGSVITIRKHLRV